MREQIKEHPYSSPVMTKHPKVRWHVIKYLLHQIFTQSLRFNEQLPPIAELCEKLQVSRTTVREAIGVLAAKGMVASKSGEGSVVLPLSSWMLFDPEVLCWLRESDMALPMIEHLIEIRLIIEPEAAALASLRGSMEQFMNMGQALNRMIEGDTLRSKESVQGDIDFHNIILESSGNIFLARLRDLCMVSVELFVRLTFEKVASVSDSIDNHQQLYEAVRSRNPEAARQKARLVLEKTVSDLQLLDIPFRRDILRHFSLT